MARKSIRLGRHALAAALMALLSLLLPTSAAQAAENPAIIYTTNFHSAAIYELRAAVSWKCLDIRGGGAPQEGAVIQTFDCKDALHQRFTFQRTGGGTFTVGAFGVYCLGTQGGTAPGTPLVLRNGWGCATFTWNYRGTEAYPNRWELVEATTGQCIRDTGRRSPVVLGACGSTTTPWPEVWAPLYDRQFDYDQLG
ncbi:RICIN domain-containing protein [Streptomyces sp. NBC_01343]|uniref:RICIN domain-containing protein n=1 Tax=Streptomyces sp. NBC_01343 TaxID=2903832 RepID=UPI002E10D224|nr:RICIN domain-containing protein [Streptomyces sp. NBC_01343]